MEQSVKGNVASKASLDTYKGPAIVATSARDAIDRVRSNSVLICDMTNVDYLVAMERAAAFVTATGSILCHAAIVARELRKPCIVAAGTDILRIENGTQVTLDLETGELKW